MSTRTPAANETEIAAPAETAAQEAAENRTRVAALSSLESAQAEAYGRRRDAADNPIPYYERFKGLSVSDATLLLWTVLDGAIKAYKDDDEFGWNDFGNLARKLRMAADLADMCEDLTMTRY